MLGLENLLDEKENETYTSWVFTSDIRHNTNLTIILKLGYPVGYLGGRPKLESAREFPRTNCWKCNYSLCSLMSSVCFPDNYCAAKIKYFFLFASICRGILRSLTINDIPR